MKKRQLFIAAGLVGALSVTGVAFATTDPQSTSVTITSKGFVTVNTPTADKTTVTGGEYGKLPTWSPAPNAAGEVSPGDLYTIAPSGDTTSVDFVATVYLSNPGQLSKDYNYLNFKVSIYEFDGTKWGTTPIADVNSATASTYLTLANGYVTFDLPAPATGHAYGVSIDDGSYYCVSSTASSGSLAPNFYISVKPA